MNIKFSASSLSAELKDSLLILKKNGENYHSLAFPLVAIKTKTLNTGVLTFNYGVYLLFLDCHSSTKSTFSKEQLRDCLFCKGNSKFQGDSLTNNTEKRFMCTNEKERKSSRRRRHSLILLQLPFTESSPILIQILYTILFFVSVA